jgi:hypothetical protein
VCPRCSCGHGLHACAACVGCCLWFFPSLGPDASEEDREAAKARYTIALLAASRLFRSGAITTEQRARLKTMIFQDHVVVHAALEAFEADQDQEELLDTLERLSRRAH